MEQKNKKCIRIDKIDEVEDLLSAYEKTGWEVSSVATNKRGRTYAVLIRTKEDMYKYNLFFVLGMCWTLDKITEEMRLKPNKEGKKLREATERELAELGLGENLYSKLGDKNYVN